MCKAKTYENYLVEQIHPLWILKIPNISRKTLNALIFIIANESADCISYCPSYVIFTYISNDTSYIICSECTVKLIHPWLESLWIIGKMEDWMAQWDRKTDVNIRWLLVNKA